VPLADLEHINAAFEAMRSDPYSGDIKFLRGTSASCAVAWERGASCSRLIQIGGLSLFSV
jgi:hypothetical protein